MRQFIPILDDLPVELIGSPDQLIPYRPGLNCHHALRDVAAVIGANEIPAQVSGEFPARRPA
ncbi:MAG: hypothetical protein ABI411_19105 [Tahibacter sp.]